MKLTSQLEIHGQPTISELWLKAFVTMLQRVYKQLAIAFNGRISFGDGNHSATDNIDGVWISVTTPGTANTDFTVNHNLNRVASGVIRMQSKGVACDVYTSPSDPGTSTTQIVLRASAISVPVVLFIV